MDPTKLNVTLLDDNGSEHAGGSLDIVRGGVDHAGWVGRLSFGPADWAPGSVPVISGPPDFSLRIDDGDREMSIASVRFTGPEADGFDVLGISAFVSPSP